MLPKFLKSALVAAAVGLGASSAMAGPGCSGKMWNPLTDLDFTLMGGIKIIGMQMMDDPDGLGSPPALDVDPLCFCKDGMNTGFGFGLTFWLPSYINDVAKQPGCLGFLNGINVLPGFMSLSSGQEYGFHNQQRDGVTNMQIHWAHADITAIAGKSLFEKCNAVSAGLVISYLTEPDFVFQNDVYSGIMSPQNAIMAAASLLTQFACGIEASANTLGEWINWGGCAWIGSRYPLSGNAIAKDSAQVTNMDITVKYLARSATLGTTLRTMGEGATCRPQAAMLYDPFQHRYQWAYPGMTSTRFNQNVATWGFNTQDSAMNVRDAVSKIPSVGDSVVNSPMGSSLVNYAQQVVDSMPTPLNFPTREAGYMQVWEARQCCLMVFTLNNIVSMIIENIATSGSAMVAELYKAYNMAQLAYTVISDPVGGAMKLIGVGIEKGLAWLGDVTGLTDTLNDITNGIMDGFGGDTGGDWSGVDISSMG